MSAFLVEKETIHAAVDVMLDSRVDMGEIVSADECDQLGTRLWEMNARAVSERYDEPREQLPQYRHRKSNKSRVAKLKAAQCLRYQCTEGTVPNLALYGQLCSAINEFALSIVQKMPEYDKAEWG